MLGLGAPELIIIMVVVMLIFGVGKLPEIGAGMGKGIREFKDSIAGGDEASSMHVSTRDGADKLPATISSADTTAPQAGGTAGAPAASSAHVDENVTSTSARGSDRV